MKIVGEATIFTKVVIASQPEGRWRVCCSGMSGNAKAILSISAEFRRELHEVESRKCEASSHEQPSVTSCA